MRQAHLNLDRELTLREWLQYAERRTPGLYQDILSCKVKAVRRDALADDPQWRAVTVHPTQTPAPVDFQNNRRSALLPH